MQGFDLSTISDCYIGNNQVSEIWLGQTKIWPSHDYSQDYLTIVSTSNNNTIKWNGTSSLSKTISVSTDNGNTWTQYSLGSTLATLNNGDKLLIKGNNLNYAEKNGNVVSYSHFSSSKPSPADGTPTFNVEGNIMSLIYGDNFVGQSFTMYNTCTFYGLFQNCEYLESAENLILPNNTVSECYASMFAWCSNLIAAPILPATILTERCYVSMFYYCWRLTTAPELPATTLADECYCDMFDNCGWLTTAPELPATTLAYRCYANMFLDCGSLTTAPELPATTLANGCYSSMFRDCRSLTTAPELPATTLTNECYSHMFNWCNNLNYIKCLATDISATNCLYAWTENVLSPGTFVKDANTTWPSGSNGIPNNWTVQNA